MKKLITAAVIVCATAFAHAATYNWSMNVYATPDSGDSALNATVYAFDANAYSLSTIMGKLTDSSIGADALGLALGHVAVDMDSGYVEMSGSGLTDTGSDPSTAHMFAILVGTGTDSKQYFYSADFAAMTITDAHKGGSPVAFGDDEMIDTGAIGGAGWTQIATSSIPEPTSGLLLLLGVAGLALKRKRM